MNILQQGAIIFDLDGTLIDSFEGIAESYRYMTADLGLTDISDAEIRSLIGPPVHEALRNHFALSDEAVEKGVRSFRRHYSADGIHKFSPVPGVGEVLQIFKDEGHQLCIATSKPQESAVIILGEAGWSSSFSIVCGSSLRGSGRSKREVVGEVVSSLTSGVRPVAMVGDRADDMAAAGFHGIPGIGVTWGFGTVDELRDTGAKCVVESPESLPRVIAECS